jgi:hypothetical protein
MNGLKESLLPLGDESVIEAEASIVEDPDFVWGPESVIESEASIVRDPDSVWGSHDPQIAASEQPSNQSWVRTSFAPKSMPSRLTGRQHVVEVNLEPLKIAGNDARPVMEVQHAPTPHKATSRIQKSPSCSTFVRNIAAGFRKQKAMVLFFVVLFALAFLVFSGIRSIYKDAAILVGRFCAATTIVCFSVFLFPFVRAFQGHAYDKLAEFASFFNPHLHQTLGFLFIAAGTFHGMLWNIATFRSCEGTWCPVEREGYDNPIVHAACIRTFCHNNSLPFDAYARGGLPSFTSAFVHTLPSNLHKSQACVRSFYYGFICWLLFATMSILAMPAIRRKRFELFYYSHHTFIIAIPFFFAHCWTLGPPSFPVQIMIIPCGIAALAYVFDKLVSKFWRRYTSPSVDTIFFSDGKILELRFKPVPSFGMFSNSSKRCTFAPGIIDLPVRVASWLDAFIGAYIDVNCPAVSEFQWHPFTVITRRLPSFAQCSLF